MMRQKLSTHPLPVIDTIAQADTKPRAFLELAGHLDCVFRHLSHKTGGLKFTCITGGQNPVTGEAVVLEQVFAKSLTG